MTEAAGAEVLRLAGMTKTYGGAVALREVDLTLRAGSVLCLLGENGAGKSTVAKLIAGVVQPDSGTFVMDGGPVTIGSPVQAQDLGVRLVPQELTLCTDLSVAENVCLGQWPGRKGLISWKEVRAEAAQRLGRLGLRHLDLTAPAGSLPVVDQAFVQIARAMTPGTRVLITDEPTAPMGAAEADRLLNLLVSVTAEGVAVVFISHRLDEVFRFGHDLAVLRDGRKVAEGKVADFTRGSLVAAMLGARDLGEDERDAGDATGSGPASLSVRGLAGGDLIEASLDVRAGEVVAVYGGSGSGRDQLGQLIFGAIRRTSGQVLVDGVPVPAGGPRLSIKAGIGYVPAERRSQGLVLDASIRENLMLASLERMSRRGIMRRDSERDRTQEWMRQMHLSAASTEARVGSLSGGNQQKILLARWMFRQPPILVLDEPTRGVDVATKADIYTMLWHAARRGLAVLVISSDVEEVARVADRVIVLRQGHIVQRFGQATQQQVLGASLGSV
jgi:ABC-type sugar transport system ATPase subunit